MRWLRLSVLISRSYNYNAHIERHLMHIRRRLLRCVNIKRKLAHYFNWEIFSTHILCNTQAERDVNCMLCFSLVHICLSSLATKKIIKMTLFWHRLLNLFEIEFSLFVFFSYYLEKEKNVNFESLSVYELLFFVFRGLVFASLSVYFFIEKNISWNFH